MTAHVIFLLRNYERFSLKLSFLKLPQLIIGGDIESNPGPTKIDCKFPCGCPKKLQVFKGTPGKHNLSKSSVNEPKVEI